MHLQEDRNNGSLRFEGILPPVTTPFSSSGKLLIGSLESNLLRYLDKPVSGMLLLGSNGEAVHLTTREKLEVIRLASDVIPKDRSLIVGIDFAGQHAATEFIGALEGYRIDALLVSAPSYYKNRMTDEALTSHFETVADRSTIPVLAYNVPQYSGLRLEPAVLGRLARHPNIIGMKDSSGDLNYLQSVLRQTRESTFQVLVGSAQILAPALVLGIRAAILAVACPLPELPDRVMKAYDNGQPVGVLQAELHEIAVALTARYGVAAVKYAMDKLGFAGGECRRPLLPLAAGEKSDIDSLLERSSVARDVLSHQPSDNRFQIAE